MRSFNKWVDRRMSFIDGLPARTALSVYAVFGPTTTAPMCVAYVSDGNVNPARGACGGQPDGSSAQRKRSVQGDEVSLPGCAEVWLQQGEMIVSVSAGGGYGDPRRDPIRVLHDVNEGWVSAEGARAVYGVVVTGDGTVDEAATASLRGRNV
jgi:N-methylhydantoinase B